MNSVKKAWRWLRKPNKTTFEQYLETFLVIIPLAFVIRTFFYGLYVVPTGSMERTMLVGERFFADKFTILFKAPERGDIISFNDPSFDYSDNTLMRLFQKYVWGPSNWTKRVIGTPGDHVQGVIEDGKPVIYVNGELLEEPYVNPYPLIALYRESKAMPIDFRTWVPDVDYEKQPYYKMNALDVQRATRLLAKFGQSNIKEPYTPVLDASGRNVDEYDIVLKDDEYWALGDNRKGSNDSRFFGPLKKEHIHGKIMWRLFSVDSTDSWLIFDMIQNPIEFWSRVRWSRFFQRVV